MKKKDVEVAVQEKVKQAPPPVYDHKAELNALLRRKPSPERTLAIKLMRRSLKRKRRRQRQLSELEVLHKAHGVTPKLARWLSRCADVAERRANGELLTSGKRSKGCQDVLYGPNLAAAYAHRQAEAQRRQRQAEERRERRAARLAALAEIPDYLTSKGWEQTDDGRWRREHWAKTVEPGQSRYYVASLRNAYTQQVKIDKAKDI